MACKREALGCIAGVQEVISYLSGETSSEDTSNGMDDDTGWPDSDPASWGWGEEEAMDTSPTTEQTPAGAGAATDPDWLDAAAVAVSPLGDVLAVATDQRVVLLNGQWDSESSQSRFTVSARLEAPEAVPVTSLLCLPLASNQRSSSGAADWTCLVVGQQSGHLVFYTEDGSLLFRQRLHESSVLSVSCSSRQVSPTVEDELTVVFEDAVVMLDGFSLYQTLRACRNQLARVRAGGGGGLEVPPLARSKWELRLQQRLETAENVGFRSTALFDHLLQQSLHRPGGTVSSGTVPAGSLLVTTG
ncbi:Rab3 GTPase-activating protein non-catalytic subunit [Amphibalanus amphitrite]|uniref:Rab3 GTPase-activating protein non-catalytic subunit n=1 Tax=Amphibalanus amphitrite TaxID=1232801 RepID=A0A6A4VL01_AMPAM|nr:Rab3 GTPase-activating protein non-catalytic subunit [Amphibalanus amphitrite]